MLRITDKPDIEARYMEVDRVLKTWSSARAKVAQAVIDELVHRLWISLIHHDAALEGAVLSYSEIKAAIDPTLVRQTANNPSYTPIKRYYDSLVYGANMVSSGAPAIRMETIKKIHAILEPEIGSGTASYRKENPLHRLYYHTIAQPEKIAYQMRKLGEWLDDPEREEMHPIARSAKTHHKLMTIFPWTKETGRCARILSNVIFSYCSFPVAIIHSIDRQKYYEALKSTDTELLELVYLEASETTAKSSIKVYEEALELGLVRGKETEKPAPAKPAKAKSKTPAPEPPSALANANAKPAEGVESKPEAQSEAQVAQPADASASPVSTEPKLDGDQAKPTDGQAEPPKES